MNTEMNPISFFYILINIHARTHILEAGL